MRTKVALTILAMLWTNEVGSLAAKIAHHTRGSLPFVYLRNDKLDSTLTNFEIYDFVFAKKLIDALNGELDASYIHPVPQSLAASQMVSWFKMEHVGAALLPTAVYKLLKDSGLLVGHRTTAFWPDFPTYLVARKSKNWDCTRFQKNDQFLSSDVILMSNEYHNEGQLAYDAYADGNPTIRKSEYLYFDDNEEHLGRFSKWPESANNRVFGLFGESSLPYLKNSEVCVVSPPISTPTSGFFLVVDQDISFSTKQQLAAFAQVQRAIDKAKDPGLAQWIGKLSEIISDSSLVAKKVDDVEGWYEKHDPFPKLVADNLIMRVRTQLQTRNISMPLMGAGARTPYLFMMGYNFLHELESQPSRHEVLVLGTSGGALNSLALSVIDTSRTLAAKDVGRFSDVGKYLRPIARSETFAFLHLHPYIFLGLLLVFWANLLFLIFYTIFYAPVLSPIFTALLLLLLGILAVWFMPSIPFEYGQIAALFALSLSAILYIWAWVKKAWRPFIFLLALNIAIFVGQAKFPFTAQHLFEGFDTTACLRDFLRLTGHLACDKEPTSESFSACLFKQVRRPLVIVATESKTMEIINFYVAPKGTTTSFPISANWINLEECPESLVTAVEASGAVPVFFSPVTLQCGARQFKLADGALLRQIPLQQARDLGANTHVIFWHSKINISDGLVSSLPTNSATSMINQLLLLPGRLLIYNQRESMAAAIEQTLFISQPRNPMITSADFWGGHVAGTDQFMMPQELAIMANDDFFASPGIFTEIAGGTIGIDIFYNTYKRQLDRAILNLENSRQVTRKAQ